MAKPALDDLDLVIKTMATTIVDNAEYFAQLDSIVGDGDFGFSLRNGFEVVVSRLRQLGQAERWRRPQEDRSHDLRQGRRRQRPDLGNGFPAGRDHGRRQDRAHDGRHHRAAAGRDRRDQATRRAPISATRRCSTRSSRRSTASRRASPIQPGTRPRRRSAPAGGRRRSQGRRGHQGRCSPCAAVRPTRASEAATRSTPGPRPSA